MKKVLILLLATSLIAIAQDRKEVAVTIYNSNLGVVKETREVELKSGLSEVLIRDVPSQINPSSVKINLDGTVIEQNYRYDLANSFSLMQHFIDKKITLIGDKIIEGTLISAANNSIVIKSENGGLVILPSLEGYNISLDYMPENLLTKPTLVWKVKSNSGGKKDAGLTYQTEGMSWKAEYVATLNKDDNRLDLNAWVNITNNSGGSFKNAKVKLIAGDINRANNYQVGGYIYEDRMYAKSMSAEEELVSEKSFFEYHIYELANKSDLLQNEDKQIGLFNASDIKVQKKFIYNSNGSNSENRKPSVSVEFKNAKDNNLGMPLPKGIVRIYKNDGEAVELIGEDNLEHTPKNEEVELKIGDAFDITIDEKIVKSTKITDKVREFEYEVTIHNSKEEPVTVEVNRNLWGNWTVLEKNIDYEKENANKITFKVEVPKEKKTTLTYKVRFVY
ncbi:MAG: DUF4139 domain-containing protein [Ignavibacteriae bacterium]|nr:DUF4139 domain-containing protein [Ignavibacteriota bacterium]MCB9221045.1 hypothetical protein [Ignavibacteria bacterium]